MNEIKILCCLALTVALLSLAGTSRAGRQAATVEKHIQLVFTGGHDTDRRDGGRPVALIAAALGVPTETFRKAFSGVTPARGRAPEPEQVHQNKDALLAVLSPFGITNDRLDEVSDYYRYQPERGGLWKNTSAEGYAVVVKGKITAFKITKPGSGYTTPPTVTIPGFESQLIKPTLKFSAEFEINGSISKLSITSPRPFGS